MHSEPTDTWTGHLTDGRSARSVEADVSLTRDGIRISGRHTGATPGIWLYEGLSSSVPLRKGTENVVLSTRAMPGASLYVADPAFAVALVKATPHLSVTAARLEGLKPGATVGAAVLAAAISIYALNLSPSKGIASLMPDKARRTLGERVLNSMPVRTVCESEAGRASLSALVQRLAPEDARASERVVVLDWNAVNAFAVPGGRVVLTRAIIQRAASADEIAGVIAHEIGHGAELHPEAGLVRSVGFWALIQMVFTGTPGAIGNAGQILAQLAYSRTSEREADDYALAMLRKARISPKPFAGLFRRLDGNRTPGSGSSGRLPASDLFSTHPATPERIAKIEGQPDYQTTPALTEQQWQSLREICGADAIIPPPPPLAGSEPGAPASGGAPQADVKQQIEAASARIATSPNDASAYRARGMIYYRNNQSSDALADLDRAVQLAPRNAGYRYDRGNIHFRLKDYGLAEADYSEAIRLNPQSASPLAARGVVHRLEKRYDAALSDLDAALAINPRYDYAQVNRGLVQREKGDLPKALSDLSAVIERNASHPAAYAFRGQIHEKLGDKDKAIADYRRALATPGTTNAALARTRLVALGQTP